MNDEALKQLIRNIILTTFAKREGFITLAAADLAKEKGITICKLRV